MNGLKDLIKEKLKLYPIESLADLMDCATEWIRRTSWPPKGEIQQV